MPWSQGNMDCLTVLLFTHSPVKKVCSSRQDNWSSRAAGTFWQSFYPVMLFLYNCLHSEKCGSSTHCHVCCKNPNGLWKWKSSPVNMKTLGKLLLKNNDSKNNLKRTSCNFFWCPFWINWFLVNSYVHCRVSSHFGITFMVLKINVRILLSTHWLARLLSPNWGSASKLGSVIKIWLARRAMGVFMLHLDWLID